MNPYSTAPFVTISIVISLATGVGHVQAQSIHDSAWQKETETRLKAIYERGEFRPKKIQLEWLPDSSGYRVEEHDPETDKWTWVTEDGPSNVVAFASNRLTFKIRRLCWRAYFKTSG